MPYVALTVESGEEAGRRIVLPPQQEWFAHTLGSDEEDKERIIGSGIVAEHACVHWGGEENDDFGAAVEKKKGPIMVNGTQSETIEPLKTGDTIGLGDTVLRVEISEDLHPIEQAKVDAMKIAAQGGVPYRWAVRFKPDGGEKTPGVLEAGESMLGLVGIDGKVAFRVPLAEVEASYPKMRSSVIELETGGGEYKLWLLEPAWIKDGIDFEQSLSAGDLVDDDTVIGGSASAHDAAEAAIGIINIAFAGLNNIANRMERNQWQKIIDGEDAGEDVAREAARSLLGLDETEPVPN